MFHSYLTRCWGRTWARRESGGRAWQRGACSTCSLPPPHPPQTLPIWNMVIGLFNCTTSHYILRRMANHAPRLKKRLGLKTYASFFPLMFPSSPVKSTSKRSSLIYHEQSTKIWLSWISSKCFLPGSFFPLHVPVLAGEQLLHLGEDGVGLVGGLQPPLLPQNELHPLRWWRH